MKKKKPHWSKIFKSDPKTWKIETIDFNSPETKSLIAECRKAQEECLDRKKIDWDMLNKHMDI